MIVEKVIEVESVVYVPLRNPLDVLPVEVMDVLLLTGRLLLKIGVGLTVG